MLLIFFLKLPIPVPVPAPSPKVPRRGPKSDEEFYIDVSEIVKEKEIGKGAYGKVYKGKFRGRTVAIKTILVKDDKELVWRCSLNDFNIERH